MKWNSTVYILLITFILSQGVGVYAQELPMDQAVMDHSTILEFDVGIDLVTIRYGKGQLVTVPAACRTISIANPDVCDVVMMGAQEFILVGKKTGQTNIYVWLENDVCLETSIRVYDDTRELVQLLEKILPYEKDIHVSLAHNTLILSGYVEKATSIESAQRIAEAYMEGRDSAEGITIKVVNMLKILEEKQILIEVRLAEVVRSVADEFGLDWRYEGDIFGTPADTSWLGGGTPAYHNGTNSGLGIPSTNGGQGTSVGGVTWDNGTKSLSYGLDYMVSEGFAKVIAKPNLMVRNGEEASFLAGGEFPVPIETDSSVQIEWKEYGIRLSFTPELDERDNIDLVLAPEVSVLDYSDAQVQISGTQVPALKTRRTETKVRLRDGESFYVSGLISQSESEAFQKTPGISNIPVLGEFFKSKDNSVAETDLVVFVTPRLVNPFKKDIEKRFDDAEQMRLIANSSHASFDQPHGDAIREFIEQGERPERNLEELKAEAIEEAIRKIASDKAVAVGKVTHALEALEDNKERMSVLEFETQRKARLDRIAAEKAQHAAAIQAEKSAESEEVRIEKNAKEAEERAREKAKAEKKRLAAEKKAERKAAKEERARLKKEAKMKKAAEKRRLKEEKKRAKETAKREREAAKRAKEKEERLRERSKKKDSTVQEREQVPAGKETIRIVFNEEDEE